jgi:hypothetical protein
MSVAIIDSTSHLWRDLLEKQGNIAKRTGNSYTAWRDVTPLHNKFVDKMLQCNMHIIATMRSKTEYVQEKNDQGKTVVRKVGLAPVQKDGMEFEFALFLDIDAEHNAFGSKDRTSIFDQKYFVITPDVGAKLVDWLNEAGDAEEARIIAEDKSIKNAVPPPESSSDALAEAISKIDVAAKAVGEKFDKDKVVEIIKKHHSSANYKSIKDKTIAMNLLNELEETINE